MISKPKQPEKVEKTKQKISSVLSQGLSQEDYGILVTSIKTGILAERLRDYVKKELRGLAPKKVDYDSPSWSYYQAHKNGLEEAYNQILKLLSIQTTE